MNHYQGSVISLVKYVQKFTIHRIQPTVYRWHACSNHDMVGVIKVHNMVQNKIAMTELFE